MDERLEVILLNALELGASDVHLNVDAKPYIRINGSLLCYSGEVVTPEFTQSVARSLMNEEMWSRFDFNGEIDFSTDIPGVVRFRVNVFKQKGYTSISIRMIPAKIRTLEQLHLPDILKDVCMRPHGLFLVTGPTGCGKSATLAAMIEYINQNQSKHIITLEDPIEYLHHNDHSFIEQREIGSDTRNFALGLRAALRQDPDIILLGEMRDFETVSTALTAAETGHLVLATLHTNDAASTVNRIIDAFPSNQQNQVRMQLASVLLGTMSQRLFPTIDGQSRRVATEVLINNPAVANLIRNMKVYQIPNQIQTGGAQGMHTLRMSMLNLVDSNLVDISNVESYLQEEIY